MKLRDELPTTALEANCCLTKESWDAFHRAMLCLNVDGHSEAPKWKAMNKKLKTYLNILSWLFGRGALAKAGESPADFGERLWNECRSFLPLLMKVSGRTVGVTRFESTKAWKNLDLCLCRFRRNKVTELEKDQIQPTTLILGIGRMQKCDEEANNDDPAKTINDIEFDNSSTNLEEKFCGHLSMADATKIRNCVVELRKRTEENLVNSNFVSVCLEEISGVDGITKDKHTPLVEFDDHKTLSHCCGDMNKRFLLEMHRILGTNAIINEIFCCAQKRPELATGHAHLCSLNMCFRQWQEEVIFTWVL